MAPQKRKYVEDDETDQVDPKLAIFYPEAGGTLFVANLHAGTEGLVTLVKSLTSGKLLVRKLSLIGQHTGANTSNSHPEVQTYRPHPCIPKLIDAISLDTYPRNTVLVTEYCNGGSLSDFWRHHSAPTGKFFPEILIWRMLSHILPVLDHLHTDEVPVSHNDIHLGNIFLHWPTNQKRRSRLPIFYLGDFGHARAYETSPYSMYQDTEKLKRRMEEPLANDIGALIGAAKVLMQKPLGCWPLTAAKVNKSPSKNSPSNNKPGCVASIAAARDSPLDSSNGTASLNCISNQNPYSSALQDLVSSLPTRSTPRPSYHTVLTKLLSQANAQSRTLKAAYYASGSVAEWHQRPQPLKPTLYDSFADLQSKAIDLPPGPWRIARVDANTMQVLDIGEVNYRTQMVAGERTEWVLGTW